MYMISKTESTVILGVASGTDSPNQTTHVRTIPTNHNTELTSWRGLQRNINPREITFPTTSEQLGLGRYGSVEVVFYKGKEHAAKRFRKDFSEAQRSSIVKKFTTEFNILSSLKHDNIVEYVGAYFNPGNDLGLPLLIMEKLVTNLKSYLEPDEGNGDPPALSMQLKLSILHDTASGLHFLHTLKPTAVIHRDLTATNVLLDENHRAKIADFGNSCVIDVDATTAVSMTCNPGTLLYSAPEVTERVYGTPVDIFSFGHLALFTINQKEPRDIRKSFTVLPNRRKTLLTEVDRRDKYFKMAYEQLEQDHVIIRMIKQCLDDEPEYRPTTTEIKVILADELKPAGQTSAATNPRTM